jgi:hypothetical protein
MWHEINYIWINYFWASDKGNGPEAIQQTIVYAIAAIILVPPVRHFIKHEFEKIHHKLDHTLSGGTLGGYVEPEWDKFEHFLLVPFKKLGRLFRKRSS